VKVYRSKHYYNINVKKHWCTQEIYPYDDNTVYSDVESSDRHVDTRITPDLAELFHSDFEDEDFDGFTDDH
jgi:hypothetical protein